MPVAADRTAYVLYRVRICRQETFVGALTPVIILQGEWQHYPAVIKSFLKDTLRLG